MSQLELFARRSCISCEQDIKHGVEETTYCSAACIERIIGILQEARTPDRFFIQRLRNQRGAIESWMLTSQSSD